MVDSRFLKQKIHLGTFPCLMPITNIQLIWSKEDLIKTKYNYNLQVFKVIIQSKHQKINKTWTSQFVRLFYPGILEIVESWCKHISMGCRHNPKLVGTAVSPVLTLNLRSRHTPRESTHLVAVSIQAEHFGCNIQLANTI